MHFPELCVISSFFLLEEKSLVLFKDHIDKIITMFPVAYSGIPLGGQTAKTVTVVITALASKGSRYYKKRYRHFTSLVKHFKLISKRSCKKHLLHRFRFTCLLYNLPGNCSCKPGI